MVGTSFGVIIFQDSAALSLQNEADLAGQFWQKIDCEQSYFFPQIMRAKRW